MSKALSNNQGVHTTSVSTLYHVDEMKIIDSPGIRDIGIDHLKQGEIILGFPEIMDYSLKFTTSTEVSLGGVIEISFINDDIALKSFFSK